MKIEVRDIKVTGPQLANVVGLSTARISNLDEKGVIKRDKDRKYPLCESVISYVTFLKKKPTKTESNYEEARARKMEASADIEEMNAAKRRGELVEIDDVVDIVQTEYGIVRQRFFAIPNKVALDVFSCESPQEVQEMLLEQMNEALVELKYDIGRTANGDQGEDPEASAEAVPS